MFSSAKGGEISGQGKKNEVLKTGAEDSWIFRLRLGNDELRDAKESRGVFMLPALTTPRISLQHCTIPHANV